MIVVPHPLYVPKNQNTFVLYLPQVPLILLQELEIEKTEVPNNLTIQKEQNPYMEKNK